MSEENNIINLDDKRWEIEFNQDMQEAMEGVVNVLHAHLTPDVASALAKIISVTLHQVGDEILSHIPEPEQK